MKPSPAATMIGFVAASNITMITTRITTLCIEELKDRILMGGKLG